MSNPKRLSAQSDIRLKERGANTYSYSERNKINVGYDANPDSDWGKYTWKGSIIVCSDELFDPTCKAIEKALGWKITPTPEQTK